MSDPYDPVTNAIQRRLAAMSFTDFIRYTKPDYEFAWHTLLMQRKIQLWIDGHIKRLMIVAPPRHSKSEQVSRRLPAFLMGKFPNDEIMGCSYSADLANAMSRDVQGIMRDHKFREVFPTVQLPTGKSKKKCTEEIFEIAGDYKGKYRAAGVQGGITGLGFTWGIIDDPLKDHEEAHSQVIRDKCWNW